MEDETPIHEKINNLLNNEHFSYEKICIELNISNFKLRRIMKKNNIKFTGEYPRFKNVKYSVEELDRKITEMINNDIPATQIETILNVSNHYVYKTMNRLGLKRKSKPIKWTNFMLQALLYTYINSGTKAAMERFKIKDYIVYQNVSVARKNKIKPIDRFLPMFDKKE
jgi:hypothetical protein